MGLFILYFMFFVTYFIYLYTLNTLCIVYILYIYIFYILFYIKYLYYVLIYFIYFFIISFINFGFCTFLLFIGILYTYITLPVFFLLIDSHQPVEHIFFGGKPATHNKLKVYLFMCSFFFEYFLQGQIKSGIFFFKRKMNCCNFLKPSVKVQ